MHLKVKSLNISLGLNLSLIHGFDDSCGVWSSKICLDKVLGLFRMIGQGPNGLKCVSGWFWLISSSYWIAGLLVYIRAP